MNTETIIQKLNLKPLPMEGGYFRETYRSQESIAAHCLSERYDSEKSVCTAIYYLITPDSFSKLHKLPTDEIYHFYAGDPVTMLQLHSNGYGEMLTVGNDLANGEFPQVVAPKYCWQGAKLKEGGEFALLGTTMAPGFDFEDFEEADPGFLCSIFPEYTKQIKNFI